MYNINKSGPRHFAAPDEQRAETFNALLDNPEINGLVAIRGGYGVTRVLENIDFEHLRRKECFVCGYSDITALLLVAWKHGCRKLIHGPMIQSSWAADPVSPAFQVEARSYIYILDIIESSSDIKWPLLPTEAMPDWKIETIKHGTATGPLIPMNLTLLCALLGTPFLPDLAGTILALEDVSEPAHDIDRNLNHLRQAGILKRLAGLVFGQFTSAEDESFLPEIQREYAEFVPGPVISNFPFGHAHPSIALPFGFQTALQTNHLENVIKI